ncbi:MAG: tetratricopeptide repeat protein [Hyphomicrobiaceae bacterium]
MRRKLAVILAADVAGYSRLVAEDEEDTLRRLAGLIGTFRDSIAKYEGRVFKTAGDAVLADFDSAVHAVRCAIDVQESLRTRNLAYPASRQINFRIGIAIGDVIDEGGELVGEGVSLASGLEAIAPVGGLCISRSVSEAVAGKLTTRFVDAGTRRLANLADPIQAYTLTIGDGSPENRTTAAVFGPALPAAGARRVVIGGIAAAGVAAVLLLGAVNGLFQRPTPAKPAAPPAAPAVVAGPVAPAAPAPAAPQVTATVVPPAPPPVAIDQAALQVAFDGCRSAALAAAVAACTPVLALPGLDASRLADVHFRLGRSHREAGQPEQALAALTRSIAAKPTADAYTHRGVAHYDLGAYDTAVADYDAAISLDPRHGEAYNNRAWTLFRSGRAKVALADADRAVALLSTESYVWDTRGHVHEALGNRDAAIRDYRQAIALDPANADSRAGLKRLGATP